MHIFALGAPDELKGTSKYQFLLEVLPKFEKRPWLELLTRGERIPIARYLLSQHRLPVERGRWNKTPREGRLCMHCSLRDDRCKDMCLCGCLDNCTGTECHYLYECPGTNCDFKNPTRSPYRRKHAHRRAQLQRPIVTDGLEENRKTRLDGPKGHFGDRRKEGTAPNRRRIPP